LRRFSCSRRRFSAGYEQIRIVLAAAGGQALEILFDEDPVLCVTIDGDPSEFALRRAQAGSSYREF
jgi:hypothetical protein